MASDSSQPHLDRFFFALRPPRPLANRIAAFAAELAGDSYRITADRLHLTVAISDDFPLYPGPFVETLLRVGDRVAAAPFAVRLDRLVRGHRSVLLLPAVGQPELRALYQGIAEGMAAARAPLREGTGFSPHMTLFYRGGSPIDRRVTAFEWFAEELVLIRSLVGLTRHETLRSWPLRAPQPAQYSLF